MLLIDRDIKEIIVEMRNDDIEVIKSGKTLTKRICGKWGDSDCLISISYSEYSSKSQKEEK